MTSDTINQKYNTALMQLVTERQRKAQGDRMRDWWYNGSLFRKILAVIYEITFYFTVAVNLIIVSGYSMRIERFANSVGKAQYRLMLRNSLRSFLLGTAVLLAAYIIGKIALHISASAVTAKKRLYIAFIILKVLGVAVLAITAYNALILGNADSVYATAVDSAVSSSTVVKLILLHLVPLGLQLAAAVMYCVINARCDGEKLVMYKKLAESLYVEFARNNPSYTQKAWESYLTDYAEGKKNEFCTK